MRLVLATICGVALLAASPACATDDPFEAATSLYKASPAQAIENARTAAEHGEAWGWHFLAYTTVTTAPDWKTYVERYVAASIRNHTQLAPDYPPLARVELYDFSWIKRLIDDARAGNVLPANADDRFIHAVDTCSAAGIPSIAEQDGAAARADYPESPEAESCGAAYAMGNQTDYGRCMVAASAGPSSPDRPTIELAEIYANGWGVKRDGMRALAYACHADGAPYEWTSTVEALAALRSAPANAAHPFDACDYATSGLAAGFCASRAASQKTYTRDQAIAALIQDWPDRQRTVFGTLRKAADAWIGAYAQDEQDMTGSMRAAISIDAASTLQDAFLDDLESFERGLLPRDAALAAADAELNAAYAAALKANPDDYENGAVTAEGIRRTQRLWLHYRDALAAFGTLRYPDVPADAWKTYATRRRSQLLAALVPE